MSHNDLTKLVLAAQVLWLTWAVLQEFFKWNWGTPTVVLTLTGMVHKYCCFNRLMIVHSLSAESRIGNWRSETPWMDRGLILPMEHSQTRVWLDGMSRWPLHLYLVITYPLDRYTSTSDFSLAKKTEHVLSKSMSSSLLLRGTNSLLFNTSNWFRHK